MKTWKVLPALILGLAAGAADAEPVEVSYLTHWSPETVALLESAAARYSEEHPDVTISVRAVPFGDLLTTIRSSAGTSAPTIAGIYDLWLPELVRDGLVAPAPEAVAEDVLAGWPSGIAAAAQVDGTLYGIPNEVNVYALNYNKALFAEAGIDGPPANWEEFLADAEALTDKGAGQQGFGLINSWSAGVVHPFASFLASNGGTLISDGVPALDSPQAGEVFDLYEKLVSNGWSVPAMGTADANTTGPFLDNFVSGKTGMIVMANWWESALKAGMGDAFENVGTAPIPVGPSGEVSSSISYTWQTVVSASASPEEQAAAWDFLAWLNGEGTGEGGGSAMSDILMSMGILPSRSSDVAANEDVLGRDFLAGYVSVLENAKAFPIVLGGQEFTEALQQTLESLEYGQISADEAQAAAQADAVSILERAAR
ncbi:ABC transporter substrate-binding protein [Frigidibacter sp. ROC022]|uniref:ABC transporter substrate-binding protein n=1 Tax=Frigidibacter sp. ROC022 TaxID=2971796 RepID=UPI00215A7FBD|nr:extracellular solute-binding protein [Frigidibacter sp. ROC022]MCR8724618.1 extracellular solute-binding protein [Frigidibacter sp. ROC022]